MKKMDEYQKDWSTKTIETLKEQKMEHETQAIEAFIDAYSEGDSVTAFDCFSAMAEKEIWFDNMQYVAFVFSDGSVYADFIDDYVNRFFLSISDFAEYDEEAANALSNVES